MKIDKLKKVVKITTQNNGIKTITIPKHIVEHFNYDFVEVSIDVENTSKIVLKGVNDDNSNRS